MTCCNAASCTLSVSFDFFVSPFTDKPAGSGETKFFPFGWFLHVIPFWGVCICQRYTQLGMVQMATDLLPSRLAFCGLDILWLSQCWAWYRAPKSCSGKDSVPSLFHLLLCSTPHTHCIANYSLKIWFHTLQNGFYHCADRPCPSSYPLFPFQLLKGALLANERDESGSADSVQTLWRKLQLIKIKTVLKLASGWELAPPLQRSSFSSQLWCFQLGHQTHLTVFMGSVQCPSFCSAASQWWIMGLGQTKQ